MAYWLIKSEPSAYSWDQLVADKRTHWDGVRNFEARNNLKAMKRGDLCLFYHSGSPAWRGRPTRIRPTMSAGWWWT